jgi:hypothetical protein
MSRFTRLLFAFVFVVLPTFAQQPSAPAAASAGVPTLVSFNGVLKDIDGKPLHDIVGVTFSLYREQEGGAPLWLETQNVSLDSQGRYSVELGSNTRNGLPTDVFSSGEARWLGVQASGQPEQSRVLLLSVPYALKAADAQTVGGLPPSAFVLAPPPGNNQAASTSSGSPNTVLSPTVSGSGTQDYLPLWTDSNGTLGNSILYQLGTGASAKIGVNMTNPLTTLDVNGTTLIRGTLEPITRGTATATKSFSSHPLDLEASSFSSTTQKAVMQHFEWQAEPTGNNTNTPGATLNLLFGQDNKTPLETGLSLSNRGLFTFAAGQKFPGTGTVTSVGLSAPTSDFTVSGSPITKNGTLALNWNVAPTNADIANAIVKRDVNGGFSAGSVSLSTGTFGVSAISAIDNSNSPDNTAISANSTNGYAVYATGGADGIYGFGNNTGVFGEGDSLGVEGKGVTGVYGLGTKGVYGESEVPNGYGVYAVAENFEGIALYSYTTNYTSAYLDGYFGHCSVDNAGDLYCTGSKSAMVPVDGGSRHVALYAMEAPENWFEDFGSGHLSDGEATVRLESTFAQTVNTGMDYYVFPVPNGDCKGLFVADKTDRGFTVRELGGGKSNVAFDYRIIARRKGYEKIRLADKTSDFKNKPKPFSPPEGQPTPLSAPKLKPPQSSLGGLHAPTPSRKSD